MRGAHRAFFLDDEEKTRRGYAFMYGNADDWDVIRDPSIFLAENGILFACLAKISFA